MSSGAIVVLPAAILVAAAAAVVVAAVAVAATAVLVVRAASAAAEGAVCAVGAYGEALERQVAAQSEAEALATRWQYAAADVVGLNARIRLLAHRVHEAGVPVELPPPFDLTGRTLA